MTLVISSILLLVSGVYYPISVLMLAGIRETQKFEDEDGLAAAYDSFLGQFETSGGGGIKVGHEPEAEALADDELEQEQIVKQKRG